MKYVVRFGLVFFKILLGLLIGCFGLLWYLSEDQVFKKYLQDEIAAYFLKEHAVIVQSSKVTISVFPTTLVLHDVEITPVDGSDWSIQATQVFVHAMIKESIFRKKIAYEIIFQDVLLQERYEKQPTKISQFINQVLSIPPAGYLDLAYCEFKRGHVLLQSVDGQQKIETDFAGSASLFVGGSQTAFYIQNSVLCDGGKKIAEQGVAQLHVQSGKTITASVNAQLKTPLLSQDNELYISGSWELDQGTFSIKTQNDGIVLDPVIIKSQDGALLFELQARTQAAFLQKQNFVLVGQKEIGGSIQAHLFGDVYRLPESLYGDVVLQNVTYDRTEFFKQLHVKLEKISGHEYKGTILSDQQQVIDVHVYKQDDTWKLFACNEQDISVVGSYWVIPKQKATVQAALEEGVVSGSYQGFMHNQYLEETTSVQGQFVIDDVFILKGSVGSVLYDINMQLQPWKLHTFKIYNDKEMLVNIDQLPDQTLQGIIDFALCKLLVPTAFAFMFSQKGKIDVTGKKNNSGVSLDFVSQDAHIRIPYIYNLIQDAHGTLAFDWDTNTVCVKNMFAQLYKGTVQVQKGTCVFKKSLYPEYVHIPVLFDKLLIGWNKQVYGNVSGVMGLYVQDQQTKITGDIVLNSTEFEGNIFSQAFQEQLFGVVAGQAAVPSALSFDCDISVQSQEPIVVKTSFLDASVKLQAHVTTKNKIPVIQGAISVLDGEFKFPYAGLNIVQGKISILPDNHFDPTIFIVAKNRIKRHEIIMRVNGTIKDPHVTFESVPHLSKEQIVAMLLFGSDDNSVVIMPEFLGNQLHDIVFGPAVSESKLESRFNAFLDPLQKIKVYPKFGNQKGRGGMRAIVEIDATEKLKGRIDSNLFQFEDTVFELDYDINDNVTARVIRDAPATYGGEVEMRWKWS